MAKKKSVKHTGMKIPPLAFELGDLCKIIDHQTEQRNWTMVYALRYIHDEILKKRNQLDYKE